MARRPALLVFCALFVAGMALRAYGLAQPWDGRDWHSALGGFATGAYARNFAEHGPLESLWMTYRWRVELADGSIERFWYTHHPVLYSLLSGLSLSLFGVKTWALQVPAFVFSALSLFACFRLVRELGTQRDALLATGFFALLPIGVDYGVLPWAEVALGWLFLELLIAYARWWKGGDRHALGIVLGCVVLGGLLDWPANFILPGLCVHLFATAWKRSQPRRLYAGAWIFVAAVAPIALHWIHRTLVVPESATIDTEHTLGWVTRLPVPLPEWLAFQLGFVRRHFTEPVLVLVGLGLVRQVARTVRGGKALEDGLWLVLLPPALFYVGLFPGRSVNHDFFWYLALPYVAITAGTTLGVGFELARGTAWRVAVTVATVVLLGWNGWSGYREWRDKDASELTSIVESPWLRQVLDDPRNVVVTGVGHGMFLHFYSSAPILSDVKQVPALTRLRDRTLSRIDPARTIYYLFDLRYEGFFTPLHASLKDNGALVREDSTLQLALFDITRWAHGELP